MAVSVVIPLYNEEENVEILNERLGATMKNIGDYEIVYVDDGSTDGTLRLLEQIQAQDENVIVLSLRRNFGQTAAFAAGFDFARGDVIVTMDGDLQNDPTDIPKLLEAIKEYDLVSGWRKKRQDNFSRTFPSKIANWLISNVTGVRLHDYGCSLKAYRRDVVKNLKLYGEMHRFIPALASWYGASICEIPIRNINRERGKSHYGIGRTFRVFFDLMTIRFLLKYMSRPLHFFGSLGALGMVTGSIISVVLLGLKILHPDQSLIDQHGPMFVVGAVLIVAGIQMLAIGLLGELQVRHYYTSQHPASYAIERMVRLHNPEESGLLSERRDDNF